MTTESPSKRSIVRTNVEVVTELERDYAEDSYGNLSDDGAGPDANRTRNRGVGRAILTAR